MGPNGNSVPVSRIMSEPTCWYQGGVGGGLFSTAIRLAVVLASITSVAAVCFYVHEHYIAVLCNPDGSERLYRKPEIASWKAKCTSERAEGKEHGALFDCKNTEACVVAVVPRVAPATLSAGAGGGAPPSSSPSHFTEHDTYDQELGRPMRVKG